MTQLIAFISRIFIVIEKPEMDYGHCSSAFTVGEASHHASSSAVYTRYINVTMTAARAGINQFDHQLEQETKGKVCNKALAN